MPNGWDRNWVRFTLTVAGFRSKFGDWPTTVRLSPDMLAHVRDMFSLQHFAALERRIRLTADDEIDSTAFFRAEDEDGHAYYYGGAEVGVHLRAAQRWLGVRPDNPQKWQD
jgi:predicted phosphoadenosine phosphosulfate sulfurtransferase